MESITVSSLSPNLKTLSSESVWQLIQQHSASDIILFPEYLLELFVPDFELKSESLVLFGSRVEDNKNQAILSYEGQTHKVPKLYLTPWEKHLNVGSGVRVFDYKGLRVAVVICFDIEQPELVTSLRSLNLDLLLVPAATESALGYERVSRCASARAVELGCAVVTSHLIGHTDHELVDENVGCNHLYLPSQSLFEKDLRYEPMEVLTDGECLKTFNIPVASLRQQKAIQGETNPAQIKS